MQVSVPIVGMAFRPPALSVINQLAVGTELTLQRQFDNPYDENAIKVLLPGFGPGLEHEAIYKDALTDALPDDLPAGKNTWNVGSLTNPFFLGYVAAKSGEAAALAEIMDKKSLTEMSAHLGVSLEGKPAAIIEIESLQEKIEANEEIPF